MPKECQANALLDKSVGSTMSGHLGKNLSQKISLLAHLEALEEQSPPKALGVARS
jgi:hypothetical protein